jgi:pyruvate/2-oxoglutarate dehydrogenase complex dihydrolipoamide dehydrogenase (E3) component
VVLATSRKPVTDLEDLTTKLPYVYLVGDAMAPRTLREATYEGYRFGRLIGDPGMPATVIESLYEEMPALVPAEFA